MLMHARNRYAAVSTVRPCAPLLLGIPKCACLRNGWSAKTLRRISASVHLVTSQELSHAINMIGKDLIEKDAKIYLA